MIKEHLLCLERPRICWSNDLLVTEDDSMWIGCALVLVGVCSLVLWLMGSGCGSVHGWTCSVMICCNTVSGVEKSYFLNGI